MATNPIQAQLHKALAWTAGASAIGFFLLFWKEILFFFFFLAVVPIALFFQQDYHPWQESMNDLAATRLTTRAISDSPRLHVTQGVPANGCAAFIEDLGREPSFTIAEQTYCKIRARTACECSPGQHWAKVNVTKGKTAGKEGWVCDSDIGLTVAWP